jgi:uncharacterized phage protein (TIGR01671 family)
MREIKFNAIDEENNDYIIYNDWINNDGYESAETHNEYLSAFLEFYFGYKLLQYTGLKDKNYVEIYEGDIVSLVDCEPSLYKIVWWENNLKYGVEYIGNDNTNWQEESLEEFDSELIEVIGNIYENPELLEEKR